MAEDNHLQRIKEFCTSLRYGILKEEPGENAWSLFCDVRNSVILVDRPEGVDFCFVVYTLHITEEKVTRILDSVDADPQFEYGLKSAVYNPQTNVNFIGEDGHFRGFHVMKKMFIRDPAFSLKDFDDTVQAVLGTGLLGTAYINSIIGSREIEQRVVEQAGRTVPEYMFY